MGDYITIINLQRIIEDEISSYSSDTKRDPNKFNATLFEAYYDLSKAYKASGNINLARKTFPKITHEFLKFYYQNRVEIDAIGSLCPTDSGYGEDSGALSLHSPNHQCRSLAA